VRVYLDTGIFIDYLFARVHSGHPMRATNRRGRIPQKLGADAEDCLNRIGSNHEGVTSALTFYEVEEAVFAELARVTTLLIPAARSSVIQVQATVRLFNIQVLDLNFRAIEQQTQNVNLQIQGVRSADSLHVTMAMINNAEVILSSDGDVLGLDGQFPNAAGVNMRCMDTDEALKIL